MYIDIACCFGMQMYKATKQQEEEHTPTFVRLQQQAEAKEEEERAEKKRRWEEQVASKKFWVSQPNNDKTVAEHLLWRNTSLTPVKMLAFLHIEVVTKHAKHTASISCQAMTNSGVTSCLAQSGYVLHCAVPCDAF